MMYLGKVVTVEVDAQNQNIHLDDGTILCYNGAALATVNRDGVVLNMTVGELCDGDKILSIINREDFNPPALTF